MIRMSEILMLASLAGAIWLWVDSMRSRERALAASRRACAEVNAQLLDETVALAKLRLCRTSRGTMALCRVYEFDFTLDGENRRGGLVVMRGQLIEDLVLDFDHTSALQ
jgi:hypothetical protein